MAVGNTIGIVVVAFLAARAAGVVNTMMMSTLSWTISPANSCNCSALPNSDLDFNNDVLPLHVPEFAEPLTQRVGAFFHVAMCNEPDPPHPSRLLCVSSKRPRCCCTAEKSDEFPTLHGIDPDAF